MSQTKISSDGQRCLSENVFMYDPKEFPPPLNKEILIITNWGKLIIGKWGAGCKEWHPMPRESKYQGE